MNSVTDRPRTAALESPRLSDTAELRQRARQHVVEGPLTPTTRSIRKR